LSLSCFLSVTYTVVVYRTQAGLNAPFRGRPTNAQTKAAAVTFFYGNSTVALRNWMQRNKAYVFKKNVNKWRKSAIKGLN